MRPAPAPRTPPSPRRPHPAPHPYALLTLALLGCGDVAATVAKQDASLPDAHRAPDAEPRPDAHPQIPDAPLPSDATRDPTPDAAALSPRDASCAPADASAGPCNENTITSCDPLTPCPCGGCCVAGMCAPEGATCAAHLGVCHDRSCGGCGALGQPCCLALHETLYGDPCGINPPGSAGWWSGPACSDPNTVCTNFDAQPNQCVPCGGAGQRCCEGLNHDSLGGCGRLGLVCGDAGLCTASCDHLGETCCEDGHCQDDTLCMHTSSGSPYGTCVAASTCGAADGSACTTCGIPGLPCCAGNGCVESECAAGQCVLPQGGR